MKLMHRTLSVLGLLGVAGSASAAPFTPGRPLTFADGRLTVELVERLRFERREDTFDFDSASASPTDDSWFVQRFRAGATWKSGSAFSFQAQVQDAREWGSDRPNVPFIMGAEGDAAADLRLAALTFGDGKTSPVIVTLGRQTLALGEERLIGVGEWNNFARSFDAAKVVWASKPARITATVFAAGVVHVEGRDGSGWKFDRSSDDDLLGGAHFAHQLSAKAKGTVEGYLFWRGKRDSDPIYSAPDAAIPVPARRTAPYDIGQNIWTIGARYFVPPAPFETGGFDAEMEAAWQWGEVDRQTTGATGSYAGLEPTLDHRAWALHSLIGYTPPDAPGRLRFTVELNLASGDRDRIDGRNESFMVLFPSNHKWYGFMDLFAWKNLREIVGTVRFAPTGRTAVRLDYHRFSLFTAEDAWYRANGVGTVRPVNPAAQSASRRAGDEIDLSFTFSPAAGAEFLVGWSRFLAGDYLRATGAASDADLIYVQTTLKL